MKPGWRRVLSCRSERDKIGVVIDCDLAPSGDLNVVAELVKEGIIVWLDRACLDHLAVLKNGEIGSGADIYNDQIVRIGVNTDIYLLTPKGKALCDANGIKRK